jgi:hypothetical protein
MKLTLPNWVHSPIWLDEQNAISLVTWKNEAEPYGAIWYHASPKTGECCFGSFDWRRPDHPDFRQGPLWERGSADPLTISPSLLCLDCGAHGFIKEGRWIPA